MFGWNANQYQKFEAQRTLPAMDLARAIPLSMVKSCLDVGCGIGNSTAVLQQQFPEAQILGVDSSENMLQTAKNEHPQAEYQLLDAGTELPRLNRTFDVVFSNACIQWIPQQNQILSDMMGLLNPSGVLAVQVPQQAKHPVQQILQQMAKSEPWREKLQAKNFYTLSESEYYDQLSERSTDFRMWETVYFHEMPSHESILEWYRGTGLRPYLAQLQESDRPIFEQELLEQIKQTYPVQKNGTIRQILERAEVLRLAMHDEPYPYIVPVNFGFTMQDDQLVLFFHGAKVGKKCDLLQKNPHISFEVEGKQQLIPPNGAASCTAGFAYESVIGQGIAELAPEEKKEDLLKKLLEHYRIPFQSFSQAHLERTAVYQIIVKQYTAKRRPIPQGR